MKIKTVFPVKGMSGKADKDVLTVSYLDDERGSLRGEEEELPALRRLENIDHVGFLSRCPRNWGRATPTRTHRHRP